MVRIGDLVRTVRPIKRGIITVTYVHYGIIVNVVNTNYFVQFLSEDGTSRVESFLEEELRFIRTDYERKRS